MWKLFAGVCVKRPAVLSKAFTDFEASVHKLYNELEVQKSHLSAHEKRLEIEVQKLSKFAHRDGKTDRKTEDSESLLTAKDFELAWEADSIAFKKLTENTRECSENKTGTSTAWRQLDKNLTLFTMQTLGNKKNWGLPVIEVTENNTLRSAVEELCDQIFPPDARCTIIGNAPVGVHGYFYHTSSGSMQGVQLFFLNAYVDKLWRGEDLKMEGELQFAWLARDEFDDYIEDKKYLRRIRSFIQDY